ncbi:hypothetical protein CHELA40_13184 [Chelatococcus asaccharovorans]|nr:hypothetical protein CHELA40_13184 [Chelatococcus asaccharovorans]CAH1679801.1 hypothetical protein CHELA17_62436 [Chelatococcus asaccharovorans]
MRIARRRMPGSDSGCQLWRQQVGNQSWLYSLIGTADGEDAGTTAPVSWHHDPLAMRSCTYG